MTMTVADLGCDAILKAYFNNSWPAGGKNLTLKLFVTNVTPADTDTAATYTEAVGGNYSAITLTNGSWTVTAGNDPSDATYAQQTWSFTGPLTTNGTIYGYFVVDADGVLVWAEAKTNMTPANNGDTYKVTPVFQISKGTPA